MIRNLVQATCCRIELLQLVLKILAGCSVSHPITLSGCSDVDLDAPFWALHTSPSRKWLSYETPIEAFARQLGLVLEM